MGSRAAVMLAVPGLLIGVGGKPLILRRLYGESLSKSARVIMLSVLSYSKAASASISQSDSYLFQSRPDTNCLSFLLRTSRSMIEAILITLYKSVLGSLSARDW